jgi:hypothetical protein
MIETAPVRTAIPHTQLPRLLLAFGVTPFLPAFYGALLFGEPWALPFGVAAAYPSALVIGWPLVTIARRFGYRQWWAYTGIGAVCALTVLIVYAALGSMPHLPAFGFANAMLVLAWGIFSGACFWLIGIAGETPLRVRDLFDVGPPST